MVKRQEGRPACKKLSGGNAGVVICLERGADLQMAQLMPLPLTVSCFRKILTLSGTGSPRSTGKRAVKRVCVCVRACVRVCVCVCVCISAFYPRHVDRRKWCQRSWANVCRSITVSTHRCLQHARRAPERRAL